MARPGHRRLPSTYSASACASWGMWKGGTWPSRSDMRKRTAMQRHSANGTAPSRTIGLQVDVIVAAGSLATHAAREATSAIPISMVSVDDAVRAGFVRTLARPGGNVTGQSFLAPELTIKGFDLLAE